MVHPSHFRHADGGETDGPDGRVGFDRCARSCRLSGAALTKRVTRQAVTMSEAATAMGISERRV